MPIAAANPCKVALTSVGNTSAGSTKVVTLGPKLEKKNVHP